MSFPECFDVLAKNRIEATNDEIMREQWYLELQDKLISLWKGSPVDKEVLLMCNSINDEILCRTAKQIYLKAFIDGHELAAMMTPKMTPK